MEKRKWKTQAAFPERLRPIFHFPFSIFLFFFLLPFSFFLASCGTPGEPTPPRPVVPVAVADLAARQQGEAVVLTFTLPAKSTEGDPLQEIPDVEIFRRAAGADSFAAQPLYTIPSALVDTYLLDGRVRFADPLPAETLAASGAAQLEYRVRTRASPRRASADSNIVMVGVYRVPERLAAPAARVTEAGIELEWAAPQRTTTGQPVASLGGYRIYRAELEPGETSRDPARAKLKTPLALLAVAPAPSYRDTQFEYGGTYLYTVRSVAQYGSESVESADSEGVVVAPRDTFAPATPHDVVIVAVPAAGEAPAQLELSWAINSESDLAGYHVYRSEQAEARGERVNRDLLLVPTFRDTQVVSGRRYTYRITAIDRSGNESSPSAPVSAEVPARGGNN